MSHPEERSPGQGTGVIVAVIIVVLLGGVCLVGIAGGLFFFLLRAVPAQPPMQPMPPMKTMPVPVPQFVPPPGPPVRPAQILPGGVPTDGSYTMSVDQVDRNADGSYTIVLTAVAGDQATVEQFEIREMSIGTPPAKCTLLSGPTRPPFPSSAEFVIRTPPGIKEARTLYLNYQYESRGKIGASGSFMSSGSRTIPVDVNE